MSHLKIKGIVDNIKERTNIYSPLIEAIVNSLEAIGETGRTDGEIKIILKREIPPLAFDNSALPDIFSLEIRDNGIGFNDRNRDSFDTLYTDLKIKNGGKGFGRFIFLKYFSQVRVESFYESGNKFFCRSFNFGKNDEIIEHESNVESTENRLKTTLFLDNLNEKKLDKKIETIARKLVEKLLIYFIDENYKCPRIILKDDHEDREIVLNDYLKNHNEIKEICSKDVSLVSNGKEVVFSCKVFKIFYPENQKSRISLVAHKREVTETPIHNYIPEFDDNFFDQLEGGVQKDFMIKTYVMGSYLNEHVALERATFNFGKKESDALYAFSQEDIERMAAKITKDAFPEEITSRQNKKKEKIRHYVDSEAPWHKAYLDDLDLSIIPYNLSDQEIELEIHKVKFQQEKNVKVEAKRVLDGADTDILKTAQDLMAKISKAEMSQLAHYIALRKTVLNLLSKSLEINASGKYELESVLHNIIFPTKADTSNLPYDSQHLWILDERLNFTEHVASDLPLNDGNSERPDLLIFNKKMAYRGENEKSNPITVFEFKKPQRDDFANASSKEDPIEQIIRYVNDIKDGKYKTVKGRNILVDENTPFYGFVVCDFTPKVIEWLRRIKDFKPMPDGQGFFNWHNSNNLYIEVISWNKLLKDAEMRNKVFFKKLGIE